MHALNARIRLASVRAGEGINSVLSPQSSVLISAEAVSRMNKSDLVKEAARRSGLRSQAGARGVEAALDAIKHQLGSDNADSHSRTWPFAHETETARILAGLRRGPPIPIPAGRAVRLKASRRAVASLNTEPLKLIRPKTTLEET